MKTLNSTVKIIAALCIIGALFFSCSINDADKHGTLAIKLPGSDSARAVAADFTDLKYRIVCSGPDEVSLDAGSGDSVSISLLPGKWTVTLTVLDSADQNIGSSEPETAVIESGKTTSVSIYVALDEYPYFGDTLVLSGQVHAGQSQDYNPENPYTHSATVSSEDNIGGNGAISRGILTFNVGIPKPEMQRQLNSESLEELMEHMYKNTSLNHENARGAFLNLRAKSNESGNNYALRKKIVKSEITEGVDYMYVDRDVTITAQGKTSTYYEYYDQGTTITTITTTTSDLNLKLKKGWNAVYSKEIITDENTVLKTKKRNFSLSLRDPVLKWVLEFDGDESD